MASMGADEYLRQRSVRTEKVGALDMNTETQIRANFSIAETQNRPRYLRRPDHFQSHVLGLQIRVKAPAPFWSLVPQIMATEYGMAIESRRALSYAVWPVSKLVTISSCC